MNYVGLDIGRSGVKIAVKNASRPQPAELEIIPSAACPAGALHDKDEAARAAVETVDLDGEAWWFGETALMHGRTQSPGNFQDWVLSREYVALIHGSLKKLSRKGFDGPWRIVAGLPSDANQELRDKVTDVIQRAAGTESRVKVTSQPAGIYWIRAAHNAELRKPGIRCAVIDPGRYSTDFAIIVGGRPISHTLRSVAGVKWAVDMLATRLRGQLSITPPFERLERALLDGHLVVNTKPVEGIATIVTEVKQQFAQEIARQYKVLASDQQGAIDHVLLGGGGADIVANELSKYVQIDTSELGDSRRLVSRGFLYAAQQL